MNETFELGYEVPDGQEVRARMHHLFISGVTQLAGKTTALEAFVHRTGCRALVFRCGRGEIGFEGAERIRPFFRERTDWRFVEGVISAHLHEKAKFYRGDIMTACRGARTLEDVHGAVRKRLAKTREGSFVHKILTELDQYLSEVVPVLREIDLAQTLELKEKVSVIDLEDVPLAVQQLIIASCCERIMEKERDVVVVIPEAWQMVPQDRTTPVKLAVEDITRRGAKLGIYCWLDSQQVTGVDQDVLRNIAIWLFGLQTHDLEKGRVAKTIPGRKVKPDDVHALKLGHFYLVARTEAVRLIYVRPLWMNPEVAMGVVHGQLNVENVAKSAPHPVRKVDPMDEKLKTENERLVKLNKNLIARVDELELRIKELARIKAPEFVAEAVKAAVGLKAAATMHKGGLIDTTGPAPVDREVVVPHLHVDQALPNLTVHVRYEKVEANDQEPRGRIGILIADGFMDEPRTFGDIAREATARGWGKWTGGNSKVAAAKQLKWFAESGFFRLESSQYVLVPAMKKRITKKEE